MKHKKVFDFLETSAYVTIDYYGLVFKRIVAVANDFQQ
jgi:hypothetical protein